jgi:PAS domain S-box-containing protein
MPIVRWFSGSGAHILGVHRLGPGDEAGWAWVTLALSALVVLTHAVIAFNWYYQSKLAGGKEPAAALARMGAIFIVCALLGYSLYAIETSWVVWRLYDACLLLLVCHMGLFALRMKGLSLVDERLARAQELEKSAQRYREIAELLPHMVWTATDEGRIDYSNRKWADYAGDDRTWLDAVHCDERKAVRQWWSGAVAAKEPATRELRLCGRDCCRTFVVNATPIARGDVTKWLGACADIEDQKLLALEKERQARQKLFFLNSLSHDLRAPLNNVALNAQLLKMHVNDEEAVQSVNTIAENAIAAGDLVTKLLDFATLGMRDQSEIVRVPVSEFLAQIVRRFRPIAEQKGLYLQSKADTPVEIRTDRVRLERVISNLVDNALKYTRHGGVELSTRETPGGGEGESVGVAILVSDTGIGIPAESVPQLFDEFYQVNNHERDSRKGFGLGLAICGHLARQIGADVRLARTGPDGSCFEVAVKGIRPARGGRPGGEAGDLTAPEEAGLCRV